MAKISVMTLSNRPGGIDIMWANMKRQTEQDFELVFVDALWRERGKEVKKYINDPRLKYIRQSDKRADAYTNLAHADNEGFRACTGELIVCLQDYIWIPPTALERYWNVHKSHPEDILVTGVGDQYSQPSESDIVDPKGKITVFKKPYTGRPDVKCWADPRKRTDQGTFYMCMPQDWELNFCAIPRKVIQELGGMDEQYDYHGFAWDNVNIAMRAELLGYHAYIDQENECMGFNHDGWWPNPLKVNRVSPQEYHFQSLKEMVDGKRPIRLNYLD
jgi:hypothetical protein